MNTAILGKSILLVEDDKGVRESIKLLLDVDRHAVTEAANGHEALQLFATSRFDLVITDYLMPEMLGDELAQTLKSLAPAQPILIVTAHAERLGHAGRTADAVLLKPFTLKDLRDALARWIQAAASRGGEKSGLAVGFSRSAIRQRAAARTGVIEEILQRKRRTSRFLYGGDIRKN